MLFATCHIQFYFPYIFDVQEGKIGDQISTTISFEKATFKKVTNLFEKIRPWWNLSKFCIINSVYIQPIWISRNIRIRMAHHSWFVVCLFSTKNINIEKTWTGLNVGFCYISNYIHILQMLGASINNVRSSCLSCFHVTIFYEA